ncbi:MAG: MFS transporter [Ruminococcaceae bacterium]|nr:MFS transporter [Oscillospiraceae bacterium]
MNRKIKENYHWLIAVLVFLEMLVYGGLINSGGVYIQPVSNGLGVNTTAYALADMPYTVVAFISTCLSGFLFKHFGYKKTATVSLVLLSLALVISATSDNIFEFAFGKFLFGMSYGACFTAGSVQIIKSWFWKHQGLVLGAVSMSSGIGGSLMTMLLTNEIRSRGWRSSYMMTAVIVAVIAALYLLIKDRPEQVGLQLYGYGEAVESKHARQGRTDFSGYPLKEQLRHSMFYLMCGCVLVSCVCIFTTSGFMVPHFISQGFTPDQAAMYQSVYMLMLSAVKLLLGFLYDRFGSKPVMVVCMLCAVVAQGILAYTNDSVLCWIAVILLAAGLCMSSIMVPLIAADLFGYEASLSVNGIFVGLAVAASLFSSPISSMCYDVTGVYTPVYRVTSVVLLGVLAVYLLMFSMAKKEQARFARRIDRQQDISQMV